MTDTTATIEMKQKEEIWADLSATFSEAVRPANEGKVKAEPASTATTVIPTAMRAARRLVCVPDRWMQCSKKHQYQVGLAAVTKAVKKMKKTTAAKNVVISTSPAEGFLPILVDAAEGLNTTIAENPILNGLMTALVRKGFTSAEEEKNEKFDFTKIKVNGQYTPDAYINLFNSLFSLPKRDKAVLAVGLYVIYTLCTKDEVGSVMTRIGDHMTVCVPGQQQGADYLIATAGLKLDGAPPVLDSTTTANADTSPRAPTAGGSTIMKETVTVTAAAVAGELKLKFESYFQNYLDDHKERALFSAVFEPVKYVHTCHGSLHEANNLDVHGQNWFLVSMIEALGEAAYPLLPVEDDYAQASTIHPYGNLFSRAVAAFRDPANFGKGFGAIKAIKNKAGFKKKNRVTHIDGVQRMGVFSNPSKIRDLFNAERKLAAADDEKEGKNEAARELPLDMQQFALMAEHLAFFFSRDYFVTKCFETLNGETRPEFVGFQKCCIALYQIFKKEEETKEEILLFVDGEKANEPTTIDDDDEEGEFYAFCYKDDYYTELNVEHVTQFFAWLGVVKPVGTYTAEPPALPDETLEEIQDEESEVCDATIVNVEKVAWAELLQVVGKEKAAIIVKVAKALRRAKTQEQQRKAAERKAVRIAMLETKKDHIQTDAEKKQEEEEFDAEALQIQNLFFDAALPAPVAAAVAAVILAPKDDEVVEDQNDDAEVKMERMISTDVMMLSPTAAVQWAETRTNSFEGDFDTAPAQMRLVA